MNPRPDEDRMVRHAPVTPAEVADARVLVSARSLGMIEAGSQQTASIGYALLGRRNLDGSISFPPEDVVCVRNHLDMVPGGRVMWLAQFDGKYYVHTADVD